MYSGPGILKSIVRQEGTIFLPMPEVVVECRFRAMHI